mgnify:CR=1 FL=1
MARIMIKMLLERIENERARSVKHSLCALACGLCFLAALLSREAMSENFSVAGWPFLFISISSTEFPSTDG